MRRKLLTCIVFLLLSTCVFAGEIKILSYNVWFDDKTGQSFRYQQINDVIAAENPDFVCLQEVTPTYYQLLKKRFSTGYHVYDDFLNKKRYGNLILSKLEARNVDILELPTKMSRTALIVRTKNLTIVNIHLESMLKDTAIRKKQLVQIKKVVSHDKKLVICGDFNFGDDEEENKSISEFTDHGKQSAEVTFDIKNNKFAKSTKFYNEPARRLDRILTRGSYQEAKFSVIKVTFSDHYPVSLTLSL